jgi:CRISPR type III-A-associated protein Csm2
MELIDWDNKSWRDKESGDFIFDLANITEKTFDITAEKWSKVIVNADRGVEKNQLRNFYDKVLELEEKAINANPIEFKTRVLPFIKMLNSKVTYAKNKQQGSVNEAFVIFMKEAIGQVKDRETFTNFRFLFEAVLGFFEKEDKWKGDFFIKQNKEKNNKNNRQNNNRRGGRR